MKKLALSGAHCPSPHGEPHALDCMGKASTRELVLWVKVFASSSDNLSLIPRIYTVQRTNSQKASSLVNPSIHRRLTYSSSMDEG